MKEYFSLRQIGRKLRALRPGPEKDFSHESVKSRECTVYIVELTSQPHFILNIVGLKEQRHGSWKEEGDTSKLRFAQFSVVNQSGVALV